MIQVKKLGFTVGRGNLQCQSHWEKGGHRDPILLLSLADLLALQNDLYSRKGNCAPLLVSLYGTSTRVALSVNGKIRLSWHQAAQILVPAVCQSCFGKYAQAALNLDFWSCRMLLKKGSQWSHGSWACTVSQAGSSPFPQHQALHLVWASLLSRQQRRSAQIHLKQACSLYYIKLIMNRALKMRLTLKVTPNFIF